MKKLARLYIRMTNELKEEITNYTEKINLTVSDFINKCVENYFDSNEYNDNFSRLIDFELQKNKVREENHNMFLIKNAFTTIITKCKVDFMINDGKINMKRVKYDIENYKKLYYLFPEHIQKLMKEDIKNLDKLGNQDYVMTFLGKYDAVKNFIGKSK